MKTDYLTDEELERLIAEVEANELVTASPDLMKEFMPKENNRSREFELYCFRVALAVAAAVMMIFVLPNLNLPIAKYTQTQSDPRKEEIPTREEVLNDVNFYQKILNELNFVNEEDKNGFDWRILK